MYCEADARQLSNPNDPDSIAVPVYRLAFKLPFIIMLRKN